MVSQLCRPVRESRCALLMKESSLLKALQHKLNIVLILILLYAEL